MSWLERAPLAQALRALAVYAWFLWRQRSFAADGALGSPDALRLLGWEMLLLILVTIVAGMVVQVLFVILSVATGQETVEGIDDERDKLIEARAMVRGFTFVGFGFLAAVLALWQGWGAIWAMHLMLGGMILCDIAVNLFKFLRYRWGA